MHGKTPSDVPMGGKRMLYSSVEARKQLGNISEATFRRLTGSGELPVVRIGTRVYVEHDVLLAYIASLRELATTP